MVRRAKPFFKEAYKAYDGVADLYVYFYELGLKILRPGGRLSMIVTNKWMKAGYAEALRRLFAEETWVRSVVDFGHAKQIFPHADVFPCVIVVQRPDRSPPPKTVSVSVIDRARLRMDDLNKQAADEGFDLPRAALGADSWALEPPGVLDLLRKIESRGVPLAEVAGSKPYRGILTGLNDAFLIDTPTRNRLIAEDPSSERIIKPYLRGQDIKRWKADWDGTWMIFARRGIDIEKYPAIHRHLQRFRHRLEPKPKDWKPSTPTERWTGRKGGTYKWYEIQDAVEYWKMFENTKILYQEIQFHPSYCFGNEGFLGNNKTFFIPTNKKYLLGFLNSPLLWWHNWRYLPHMKDEALSPAGFRMEALPVAMPDDDIRTAVDSRVDRLIEAIELKRFNQLQLVDWLQVEFDVARPTNRLDNAPALSSDEFIAEVRRSRDGKGKLSPAAVAELRQAYETHVEPARRLRSEAAGLEREVSELVNAAYGLTEEEVALMWRTAPPRTPLVDQYRPAGQDGESD